MTNKQKTLETLKHTMFVEHIKNKNNIKNIKNMNDASMTKKH